MSMTEKEKEYWRSKRFTIQGRIFHAKVLKPEPKRKRPDLLQYSALVAWPLPSQMQIMQQIGEFLARGKQMFYANIPEQFFTKPIKKWGEYVRQDGKPVAAYLEGCRWMNLTSGEKFPPQVVDQDRNIVLDPAEIYSGRNVLINFSFFGYSNEGKSGISANLNAVMLLPGGDRVAVGAGGVDLDEAFGGFAADMGLNPATAQAQAGVNPYQPQANNAQWTPAPAAAAAAPAASANPQGGFNQGGPGSFI